MPASESFDAFYARTAWNVTSQMHALAGDDSVADHAIREAYARAYQQWYEVSAYPDTEAWVLGVAKDAYQRRLTESGALRGPSPAPGHDPLTWPGMFRPARPKAEPLADPDATLAPRPGAEILGDAAVSPAAAGPVMAGPVVGDAVMGGPVVGDPLMGDALMGGRVMGGQARSEVPPGSLFGSPAPGGAPVGDVLAGGAAVDWAVPAGAAHGGATADWAPAAHGGATADWAAPAGAAHGAAATAGMPGATPSGRALGGRAPGVLSSRRNLIAVTAATAVLVAGVIVYALGGHGPSTGAPPGVSAKAAAKPTPHMLAAGQTGGRAAIPWSLLGPGWTLAEVSTAQPNANGAATGGGRYMIYLVDPVGGKYRIWASTGGGALDLLAWSGDGKTALYDAGAGAGGAPAYGLLTLASGQATPLQLPAGVTAMGFTRPDGFNILAVHQKGGKYRLERYSLDGTRQATIGSLPRPAHALAGLPGNALSSPAGDTAVWGVSGDEMQLVHNTGGLIRRLRVPGAGSPASCTPISWWSSHTVLAYCNVAGSPGTGQLWLIPDDGSQATPLASPSGSTSGIGDLTGAWRAGGAVYITSTTSAQCTTAAGASGGQQVLLLSPGGALTPVAIPDSTNHHATVVAGVGRQLLVVAQTSCPGTSSLILVNTSTHAAQTVLTAPASEVGVVDAVPYGSGPAATTNGLN
jgi:TolB protein